MANIQILNAALGLEGLPTVDMGDGAHRPVVLGLLGIDCLIGFFGRLSERLQRLGAV